MGRRLVLSVVVLVLLGLAGLGYAAYRGVSGLFTVISEVDDPVREMHAAMAEGQGARAYGFLAQSLRERVDRAEFEREFKAQRIWGDAGKFAFNARSVSGDLARIRGIYTRADGSVLPVFVELVRERGAWRISRFHFGAPPPEQKEWTI